MENNDILARFHELNYREVLDSNPDKQSTLRVESGQWAQGWSQRATESARRMVCRYDFVRRTSLCDDQAI